MAHHYGLNEGCDNHFSLNLTVDGIDCLLTLPHGILWSTVQPGDFILADFQGNVLRHSTHEDTPGHVCKFDVDDIQVIRNHGYIHAGLGKKRARAVFHTHQVYASVLASTKRGDDEMRMVHQNSCRFFGKVLNYRDFNGLGDNVDEGISFTKEFKKKGNEGKRIMLMRNHGILAIASNAAEAMMDTYFFEKAAQVQIELTKMGQNMDDCEMDLETARKTANYIDGER